MCGGGCIKKLHSETSWQDVENFATKADNVCHSQVNSSDTKAVTGADALNKSHMPFCHLCVSELAG